MSESLGGIHVPSHKIGGNTLSDHCAVVNCSIYNQNNTGRLSDYWLVFCRIQGRRSMSVKVELDCGPQALPKEISNLH